MVYPSGRAIMRTRGPSLGCTILCTLVRLQAVQFAHLRRDGSEEAKKSLEFNLFAVIKPILFGRD
jgi:hypothetical protein